jgi:hypothetical protein
MVSASGIASAIAESMLYWARRWKPGGSGHITRSWPRLVGRATAIVGMAVAGFPMGFVNHPLLRWVVGLAVAISIHTAYNNTAFHHFVFGQTGLLVLAGINFSALLLVAGVILWGLRRERNRLRKSLGAQAGVSKGEAMLVQRIEDLDDLLAPVEGVLAKSSASRSRARPASQAQLNRKQDLMRKTKETPARGCRTDPR